MRDEEILHEDDVREVIEEEIEERFPETSGVKIATAHNAGALSIASDFVVTSFYGVTPDWATAGEEITLDPGAYLLVVWAGVRADGTTLNGAELQQVATGFAPVSAVPLVHSVAEPEFWFGQLISWGFSGDPLTFKPSLYLNSVDTPDSISGSVEIGIGKFA